MRDKIKVFITGGAGYIGSHTVVELIESNFDVCIFDNYSNSSHSVVEKIEHLTGTKIPTVEGDVRDYQHLLRTITDFMPDVVIHFAGKKSVADSIINPVEYYENNVQGTICLLNAMNSINCNRIVFSSSATVYGIPRSLPIEENHVCAPINPYGFTKYFSETIIKDWSNSIPDASAVNLRYFNPVGAHPSALIGENPQGTPSNLAPFISGVAMGIYPEVKVFGNDFDTRDGSGERDYIHVVDLARAHRSAVQYVLGHSGCESINIGTGTGVTVFELLKAFEKSVGQIIPHTVIDRRPGDVDKSIACVKKAKNLLSWSSEHSLDGICDSAWRWQQQQ